jgi:hypothetical protein
MNLRVGARTVPWLVICVFTISSIANAQNAPEKLKEVQLGADAFSL